MLEEQRSELENWQSNRNRAHLNEGIPNVQRFN